MKDVHIRTTGGYTHAILIDGDNIVEFAMDQYGNASYIDSYSTRIQNELTDYYNSLVQGSKAMAPAALMTFCKNSLTRHRRAPGYLQDKMMGVAETIRESLRAEKAVG